jgi:hypothetical protein
MALLDSEKQLFIYDLMAKKLLIQFDPFLLQSKNEIHKLKDVNFCIADIQFSKNSSLLAIVAKENSIVLLVNISKLLTIDRIYNSTGNNERIILDPKNKYLFLECNETGLHLKYFKNLIYNLKIIEFCDEEEIQEKEVQIEFLLKYCDKRNKLVMVLRNKRMFLVKYSFFKENKDIFEENVKILMNLDIKFLISPTTRPIISRDCDKIILVSKNKIEVGFQFVYGMEGDTLNSIKMNKLKEVFF